MASPIHFFLLAAFSVSLCNAGPLPNVTSVDIGLKEGSCALGDVVYMPGDAFPGTSACEKCTCSDGVVQCTKQRCEPRPGCKAVHRPDHCCPTYQCECEQEGRIYGNGEKLVDPLDPCRVCYCQGGEVVCRRIACFVRDDCQPRLVPGRCCPEYDNCPVRDGTPLPGVTSSLPSMPIMKDVEPSSAPPPSSEPAKPEITIKEITPVSEIPVRTDVKIKEILPSPSIEVAEYASSKSPPIPREATSENPSNDAKSQIDSSESKGGLSSMSPDVSTSSEQSSEIKDDEPPSKISLASTQDSVNDIIPSRIPSIVPMMGPSMSDLGHLTTKPAMIEEEDLDHNPAFPPIPDDLFLVLSNHDEESEQSIDSEHVSMDHDVKLNVPISTQQPIFKESPATTIGYISDIVTISKDILGASAESSTHIDIPISTLSPFAKENTMLNMRSVIPTDILNSPSLISDDSTGDILDVTEGPITRVTIDKESSTEIKPIDQVTKISQETEINSEQTDSNSSSNETVANEEPKTTEVTDSGNKFDETTNALSKSTEIISETEFSSIPIETSDQNPHDISESEKEYNATESTPSPITESSIKLSSSEDEVITLSRALPSDNEQSFDNSETTEFIMSSFDSQESTTDAVELIKVVDDSHKSSSLIEPPQRNSNVLTDLINLVGDVASISDHTDGPEVERQTSSPTTISDSEELIPVNVAAGYKSKNKNWNLNSITEIPLKNKIQNKQKVIEIEGDDTDTITDSPPPYDKVEPTTRLPIIDNVSDTNNKTEISGKKDIEIITQSYVPTFNRRPTKIMKKEKPAEEEVTSDATTDVGDITSVANSEATTGPEETEKSSQ